MECFYEDSLDLKTCELVCRLWQRLVRRLWDHHEFRRVGRGWSGGEPSVETIAVRKERSVCTVTSIATDDTAIACALGSSGKVELWDRRQSRRVHMLAALQCFVGFMISLPKKGPSLLIVIDGVWPLQSCSSS